jgi:hypothetical protein
MKKVFLGGTCNKSTWRDELIPLLKLDYFNPVVANWTPKDREEELGQRQVCDFCLYVLTPKMTGVYSIAEVVDDSHKRPEKTIFCFIDSDDGERFTSGQRNSLEVVGKMVRENGATVFHHLTEVADYLNASVAPKLEGKVLKHHFLNSENTYQRLLKEYKQYGSIVVAVDFDNTLYDYHKTGLDCSELIELAQNLKKICCSIVLWTASEDIDFIQNYCSERAIPFDLINENPSFFTSNSRKIYYNELLDDRAGLTESYQRLCRLYDEVKMAV